MVNDCLAVADGLAGIFQKLQVTLQTYIVELMIGGALRLWGLGTEIYFRGELVLIEVVGGKIRFGSEQIKVSVSDDLRLAIQNHLRKLAQQELPARVQELARNHGVDFSQVTVRNQKSRWGSCSRKGTISLNWRLIQTPELVCDYIVNVPAGISAMPNGTASWLNR